MTLKTYKELYEIDVLPFCEFRKAKDDKGKEVNIPYLSWAKCKQLLHENGAENVYYTPLRDETGSYVFSSIEATDKNGRKTGCYFVRVEIHIDDKKFTMDMPVMNGSLVVYQDTINQLRISNSHARAFVKGVAIHTGLGFNLWVGDNEEDLAAKSMKDDMKHEIYKCKQQLEQMVTAKIGKGISFDEILSSLKINQKQWNTLIECYDKLKNFEKAIESL